MTRLYIFIIGIVLIILFELIWSRRNKFDKDKAIEIGILLFDEKRKKFEEFITMFVSDRSSFNVLYADDFPGEDIKKIKLIDLVALFGDIEGKVLTIDWRGEENEGEVQQFCEQQLGKTIVWNAVGTLRNSSEGVKPEQLFTAINNDLSEFNYQLAFLNTANDSYQILVLSESNLQKVMQLQKNLIKTKV